MEFDQRPDRNWPRITKPLYEQLLRVEPSRDRHFEYRPSRLRLIDGSIVDRAYVAEARSYIE